jgi:hypothetical protein
MALLSLEQLLNGVFVIAAPPKMGVGTSEEDRRTSFGRFYWLVTLLFAFINLSLQGQTASRKQTCKYQYKKLSL